jgi:prepilin-type N-terminal cleavage/methylation domain-containing protein
MLKTKYPIFKCMHHGEKGFTLIELLVVIAILGVIAAVVALNVGSFFGRGTVQAANTELHQVQTAVISAMAECQTGNLTSGTVQWSGGFNVVIACGSGGDSGDAGYYLYGPLRASYTITNIGRITGADLNCTNPWSNIVWDSSNMNWKHT